MPRAVAHAQQICISVQADKGEPLGQCPTDGLPPSATDLDSSGATMNDSDGQPEPRLAAEGEEPLLGEYPPFELTTISADDVARMPVKRPGPVTLQDRQGVFAHSFKCSICDLEFVVFSWRADRHRVGSTFCPECGVRTPMIHWRVQTSQSLEFCSDGPGREIYQMFSPADAALMHDSVLPAEARYEP